MKLLCFFLARRQGTKGLTMITRNIFSGILGRKKILDKFWWFWRIEGGHFIMLSRISFQLK